MESINRKKNSLNANGLSKHGGGTHHCVGFLPSEGRDREGGSEFPKRGGYKKNSNWLVKGGGGRGEWRANFSRAC